MQVMMWVLPLTSEGHEILGVGENPSGNRLTNHNRSAILQHVRQANEKYSALVAHETNVSHGTLTTEEWKAEQQLEHMNRFHVPVNSIPSVRVR
ncbi:hypothetical protein KDA_64540 [Dictyobacter alpinus]|uniref:Uncharacterized protein n=1 Tax=Dictyobacter alpinus TaxID=2014873 RepID=A0A402BI25_9CHLR|nr:hypothetical protein KDA_64540 [Dictyobacter alpinus]